MSFCGRLCSGMQTSFRGYPTTSLTQLLGIGSDVLSKIGMSRFWCLFVSSGIFCAAQVCGARIENPHLLGFVSGLTGCKTLITFREC